MTFLSCHLYKSSKALK